MKQGHRNMLGLFTALFGAQAAEIKQKSNTLDELMMQMYNGSPVYHGKSQKAKKHNRLNISHKTRLKHRRAA